MKKDMIRSIGTWTGCLIVTLTLLCSVALAQSPAMKASIPFDFYFGEKLVPAGNYVITALPSRNGITLSNSTGTVATLLTMPSASPNTAKSCLIFRRYGNKHFLGEFYWNGYSIGHALPTSKAEAEVRIASIRESETLSASR